MKLPMDYTILTPTERREVRQEYVKRQGGRCMYCNNLLTEQPIPSILKLKIDWDLFPPNFLRYPVHLQHNHDTGMTEGAVHAYCNAVLWQYEGR